MAVVLGAPQRARIVEMHQRQAIEAHQLVESVEQGHRRFWLGDVVARSPQVGGVQAERERSGVVAGEGGGCLQDLRQLLHRRTQVVAASRRVLQHEPDARWRLRQGGGNVLGDAADASIVPAATM